MNDEIWMPINGFNDYFISNIGRVKSYHRYKEGRFLKPGRASTGYYSVSLTKDKKHKSHLIQILVLEAFVCLRPPGMFGLHNDSDKANNTVSNLRWGTSSDNAQDQIKHGTFNFSKGEGHQLAKLKNGQVSAIKRLLDTGLTQTYIANRFGINQRQVSKIKTGIRWGHITA